MTTPRKQKRHDSNSLLGSSCTCDDMCMPRYAQYGVSTFPFHTGGSMAFWYRSEGSRAAELQRVLHSSAPNLGKVEICFES